MSFKIGEPIYNLEEHMKKLDQLYRIGENRLVDGYDVEYLSLLKIDRNAFKDEQNFKTSLLPQNEMKNRYQDVLANEHTRVILEPSVFDKSDYINANYVRGKDFGVPYDYISTQGPIEDTIYDFWRMIWQEKCPLIVMVAKEVERGRRKCHVYWPEKTPLKLHEFTISLEKKQEHLFENRVDVIHRTIKITKNNEERKVEFLQYIGWPDHDVPKTTNSFRNFYKLASNQIAMTNASGPIVVHCSAGIGRTGTFLCIHITLTKLERLGKEKKSFNIYETVKKLKSIRSGMVQTKSQYKFCYQIIREEVLKMETK